jgi:D-glycero-alpha-D-manno-heptose-7-phosphate kinase
MIIVRSPFRLPIAGGGTDIDFYYKKKGGDLISVTFNQYIYILISKRPLDKKILVQTTDTQFANSIEKVKNKLVKSTLSHFGLKKGIQVGNFSTLPTKTGLGSSSTLTVGLIKGLSKIKGIIINKKKLAELAYNIERKKLKFDGGWQDQIISSYGGFQRIKISKKGKFITNVIKISKKSLKKLEDHFILIFTEESRKSKNIIKEQRKNIKNIVKNYDFIKSKVNIMDKAIKNANIKLIGEIFHQHWLEKKKLTKNITNEKFNRMYSNMMEKNLFYGGKIIGAGGGGFFLMVSKNPQKAFNYLKNKKYRYTKIKFDFSGCKIISS